MQIDSIKPTTQPLIRRIKQSFTKKFSRLKILVKDVFEREKTQYLVIDGKKIKEKDLPNSVTGPSDIAGITWSKISFYPEDLAKMEHMNVDERLKYKRMLIEQNRYID